MAVNTYNLDRKTVSRMLGCSLRTVDRYVSSGRIGFVKNAGRTWLSAEDVRALMTSSPTKQDTYNEYVSWREKPGSKQQTNDFHVSQDDNFIPNYSSNSPHSSNSSMSYKQLYNELKSEVELKDNEIEQLKLKLMQIETALKQMVPLLELQKQQKLLSQNNQRYAEHIRKLEDIYKKKASELKHEISIKEHEIEVERFNKAIFAVVLFLVLLLQPVFWFMMT